MKLERIPIELIDLPPSPPKKMPMPQVQPVKLAENGNGRYSIVDGHGRISQLKQQGEIDVWAVIERLDSEEIHWQSLAANLSVRENPMKSAYDIAALIESGYSQTEIAKKLGVSQPQISRLNSLNELPVELQQKILDGSMPANAGYKALELPADRRAELFDLPKVTIKAAAAKSAAFRNEIFDLSDLSPLPPQHRLDEDRRKLVLNGNSWDRLNSGETIVVEWGGLEVEVRAR